MRLSTNSARVRELLGFLGALETVLANSPMVDETEAQDLLETRTAVITELAHLLNGSGIAIHGSLAISRHGNTIDAVSLAG